MLIKTKKYELPKKKYIKMAMMGVLRQQWWVSLIVLAICAGYLIAPSWWWFFTAFLSLTLYLIFWLIQFWGVTYLEQGKLLFQKLSYEITSQQIVIMLNTKQGMPVKWDQIKRVRRQKDGFLLFMSKAQVIHWPERIFNHDNEIRFIETVLKRKGLIKS